MVISFEHEERRVEKFETKKRNKNYLGDVFPCGFPISSDKKGGKVRGIVFCG